MLSQSLRYKINDVRIYGRSDGQFHRHKTWHCSAPVVHISETNVCLDLFTVDFVLAGLVEWCVCILQDRP